jgi:hypothetical protein
MDDNNRENIPNIKLKFELKRLKFFIFTQRKDFLKEEPFKLSFNSLKDKLV